MEIQTFFESDDDKNKREARKKPANDYAGYAGFLAQNLNAEKSTEAKKPVALPEGIIALHAKAQEEAAKLPVEGEQLDIQPETDEDDEDEEEEDEKEAEHQQTYRFRAQPPARKPQPEQQQPDSTDDYELWRHNDVVAEAKPEELAAMPEIIPKLETEAAPEPQEAVQTDETYTAEDSRAEEEQPRQETSNKQEDNSAEKPVMENSYEYGGSGSTPGNTREYVPPVAEPERTVYVKRDLADSLKLGVFTYLFSRLGWRRADRKLESRVNDQMERNTKDQQQYTNVRFEQLRKAQVQAEPELQKITEPLTPIHEALPDPVIRLKPREHLQHSAWHNIVVDERGHEVSDAIKYGKGYQQERQQELGKHQLGPSLGSAPAAIPTAPQYPAYRDALPSGMTSPTLPAGNDAYTDPQRQLPAYDETQVVPGMSNIWLWLILLLIICAIVTALFA